MRYKVYTDIELLAYQYRTRLLAIVAALMGLIAMYLAFDLISLRHEIRGLNGNIVALEQSVNTIIDLDKLMTQEGE